jgi:hypothetical protein
MTLIYRMTAVLMIFRSTLQDGIQLVNICLNHRRGTMATGFPLTF